MEIIIIINYYNKTIKNETASADCNVKTNLIFFAAENLSVTDANQAANANDQADIDLKLLFA